MHEPKIPVTGATGKTAGDRAFGARSERLVGAFFCPPVHLEALRAPQGVS